MNANGLALFCVTSYGLSYNTEDSFVRTPYKENGVTKVLRGYVRISLCNNMFIGLAKRSLILVFYILRSILLVHFVCC